MEPKVIDLDSCRDLLGKWNAVRERIISGKTKGFITCEMSAGGDEAITLAGRYSHDKEAALSAAMQMSWELTKRSDFRESA